MNNIVKGGYNYYGIDVGILILDSTFPRIPGDIGNAETWDFPVVYKKVVGGTPSKVVLNLQEDDISPFILAAQELEKEGVKLITTSCGFLSLFQDKLAAKLNIPIFTSALLIVPFVQKIVGNTSKVGILTANSQTLSRKHLESVGIMEFESLVIYGLQDRKYFTNFTVENWDSVNVDFCRNELVETATLMMKENKDIGAIVLECTNMPPYSKAIQEKTGVPVFDIVSLTNMMYCSIHHKAFL